MIAVVLADEGICPATHPRPIAPASHNDVPVEMLRTFPLDVNTRPEAQKRDAGSHRRDHSERIVPLLRSVSKVHRR